MGGPAVFQGRSSRDMVNRIIIARTIGGPAASPAAGTNISMTLMSRVAVSRRDGSSALQEHDRNLYVVSAIDAW